MMSILISISLLCLCFPQGSCAVPESEEFANTSCNVTEGGRHLLQMTSPQELQAPIAAAEDATSSEHGAHADEDDVTPSHKLVDDKGMPAAANKAIESVGKMIGFGKAINDATMSVPEKTVTGKDNGVFQQYLEGDDHDCFVMTSSVYDVSSVISLPQYSSTSATISKHPEKTILMSLTEDAPLARSSGIVGLLVAIFFFFLVAMVILLVSGKFDGRETVEIERITSSDSDLPDSAYHKKRPTFARGGHFRRNEPPMQPMQYSPGRPPAEMRASEPTVAMRMARPPTQPVPLQSSENIRMSAPPMVASPIPPPAHFSQPSTEVVATGPLSSSGDLGKPPTSSRYLCPGLVVPKGNECTLVVPAIRSLNVPFFVRDISGKPVIQAEVLAGQTQTSSLGIGVNPIVVLRSAMGMEPPATVSNQSPLLTYVKPSSDSHGRQGAYIYDARDEIFAHISKNPLNACYVLTSSRMGLQAVFTGTFADHHVSVAADTGKALAEVEPTQPNFDRSNSYYRICVFTQVDVGLILCSLLSIDCLESA